MVESKVESTDSEETSLQVHVSPVDTYSPQMQSFPRVLKWNLDSATVNRSKNHS